MQWSGMAWRPTDLALGKLDAHGEHIPLGGDDGVVNVLVAHAAAAKRGVTRNTPAARTSEEAAAAVVALGSPDSRARCAHFKHKPHVLPTHRNSVALVGLAMATRGCMTAARAAGRPGRRTAAAGCRAMKALLLRAAAMLLGWGCA